MIPKLGGFIGKTILVSIPALFGDGRARPYRLAGIELHGLWLQSSELVDRLLQTQTGNASSALPAFVPFAQIAAVLVVMPPQIGTGATSVPASQTPSPLASVVPTRAATSAPSATQRRTKKK